jgi:hypothetical protein
MRLGYLISLSWIVCMLAGCQFAVKSTEGLKAYLNDQTEVERSAVRLRERFTDPKSEQYQRAKAAYEPTVLASTQFIRGVNLDASIRHEVNVTAKDYENDASGVQASFKAFKAEADKLMGSNASALGLGTEAAAFVLEIIKNVIKLDNEARDRAVARLKTTMEESLMLEFDQLSSSALRQKYQQSQ